ncbi:MAG: S8 family serine peptidase, partial [bacterium]|nr:S8 family serine peptidase [bacterium]
ERDSDPLDEMGHGTYVAGMAAAVTDNGRCIAGVGFGCRILPLRTANANGYLEEDDVAAALLYGAQIRERMGALVLNMSFGDNVVSPLIRDAVQLAAQSGVILLGSAGNSTSQEIHYPSGFPEVISVGATTQSDYRASFSNYGPSVDVMAPGSDILSTMMNGDCGEWIYPHGTSYAVALVSGVVGLMLDVNPALTGQDVKQILRSTADDIGAPGWDDQTTHGRVNARRAVERASFGSNVVSRITSPHADAGFAAPFEVYGEASGSAFARWTLLLGCGENPAAWQEIASGNGRIYGGLMGTIQIPEMDTVLIARLEVEGFEGSRSVDHVHLYVQHAAPRIDSLRTRIMLDEYAYGELVQVWVNQATRASLLLTNALGDSIRRDLGYITDSHAGFLSQLEYSGNWNVHARLENAAGMVSLSEPMSFAIHEPSFASNLWELGETSLTHGHLSPFLSDFNGNGRPEAWRLPITPGGGLSDLEVWEWTGTDFAILPLTYGIHIPQAIGDADGDGLLEMMGRRADLTRIWEQRTPDGILDTVVFEALTNLIGAEFLDLDSADGHGEIIARTNTDASGYSNPRFVIYSVNPHYSLTGVDTLPNLTEGTNDMGPPKVLIGDLDRDGALDFVYGDYDGDVVFCEREGGRSQQCWSYRLPLNDATAYLAAGDFDGDGASEFVAGCRSNALGGTESERASRHWAYVVFERAGDNGFSAVDSLYVLGNEEVTSHLASVSAGDVNGDGRDEILISAYPDQYVIAYDPDLDRYRPLWYHYPSESNVSLAADLNGDGSNEFLLSDGSHFLLARSTGGVGDRPPPPFGLTGEPLGPNRIRLQWRQVPQAEEFRVYRAATAPEFSLLIRVTDTLVVLDDVPTDVPFTYAVRAYAASYPDTESVFSNFTVLAANELPLAEDTARFVCSSFVHVSFSEPMGAAALQQGGYRLDDGRMPAVVMPAEGGRVISLTFDGTLDTGWHTLELRSLRDAQGARLPEEESFVVFEATPCAEEFPRLVSCSIPSGVAVTSVELAFSEAMSPSVLDRGNYVMDSPRQVIAVDSLAPQRDRLRLHLDPRFPVGGLGLLDTLWLQNITAQSGRLLNGTGRDSVLLGSTAHSIADAYVYPNPYRGVGPDGTGDAVMFAGLPETAIIRIFTLQGVLIRKIEHADLTGGSRWDLTNENGDKVASGVYLYSLESNGETVRGKLAVMR